MPNKDKTQSGHVLLPEFIAQDNGSTLSILLSLCFLVDEKKLSKSDNHTLEEMHSSGNTRVRYGAVFSRNPLPALSKWNEKTNKSSEWVSCGITEIRRADMPADFFRRIAIDFEFGTVQRLKFEVYESTLEQIEEALQKEKEDTLENTKEARSKRARLKGRFNFKRFKWKSAAYGASSTDKKEGNESEQTLPGVLIGSSEVDLPQLLSSKQMRMKLPLIKVFAPHHKMAQRDKKEGTRHLPAFQHASESSGLRWTSPESVDHNTGEAAAVLLSIQLKEQAKANRREFKGDTINTEVEALLDAIEAKEATRAASLLESQLNGEGDEQTLQQQQKDKGNSRETPSEGTAETPKQTEGACGNSQCQAIPAVRSSASASISSPSVARLDHRVSSSSGLAAVGEDTESAPATSKRDKGKEKVDNKGDMRGHYPSVTSENPNTSAAPTGKYSCTEESGRGSKEFLFYAKVGDQNDPDILGSVVVVADQASSSRSVMLFHFAAQLEEKADTMIELHTLAQPEEEEIFVIQPTLFPEFRRLKEDKDKKHKSETYATGAELGGGEGLVMPLLPQEKRHSTPLGAEEEEHQQPQFVLVASSSMCKNTSVPIWDPFVVPMDKLFALDDYTRPLQIRVVKRSSSSPDGKKTIGSLTLTGEQLMRGSDDHHFSLPPLSSEKQQQSSSTSNRDSAALLHRKEKRSSSRKGTLTLIPITDSDGHHIGEEEQEENKEDEEDSDLLSSSSMVTGAQRPPSPVLIPSKRTGEGGGGRRSSAPSPSAASKSGNVAKRRQGSFAAAANASSTTLGTRTTTSGATKKPKNARAGKKKQQETRKYHSASFSFPIWKTPSPSSSVAAKKKKASQQRSATKETVTLRARDGIVMQERTASLQNEKCGTLHLLHFRKMTKKNIIDYFNEGLSLKLTVSVDFTASNGNPNTPHSYHYKHPTDYNDYERAMKSVADALTPFTHSNPIRAYGFGGLLPGDPKPNHCFALAEFLKDDGYYSDLVRTKLASARQRASQAAKGRETAQVKEEGEDGPENATEGRERRGKRRDESEGVRISAQLKGVEELLQAYRGTLACVALKGPTVFSNSIKAVVDRVERDTCAATNRSGKVERGKTSTRGTVHLTTGGSGKGTTTRNSTITFPSFNVLLILTDGILSDWEETLGEIGRANDLPLFICIVGIGSATNFSKMQQLSEQAYGEVLQHSLTGTQINRSMVEFLSQQEYRKKDTLMAQKLLERLPQLVEQYICSNTSMHKLSAPSAHETEPFPFAAPIAPELRASPPVWVADKLASECSQCASGFTMTHRKHHCRSCGNVFCANCSSHKTPITAYGMAAPTRVCDACYCVLRRRQLISAILNDYH